MKGGIYLMTEARISMTPFCNFKCFFCHNEGIQVADGKKPSFDKMQILLNELLENGFTDITFTGGEPFLYADVLLQTIHWLKASQKENLPQLTLVTNASLVKPEYLEELTSYPRLKIHVSLHTTDEIKYEKITNQRRFPLNQALKVIQLLSDYHIPFKINYVLLRGINTSEKDIWNVVELAETYGAKAVKFLELLVMEKNETLYPFYYHIDSLEVMIKHKAKLVHLTDRRKTYRLPHGRVDIELQRLTCKIGCESCLKNRDQTFTAGLQYFPCMETAEKFYEVRPGQMETILEQGFQYIGKLSKQYGYRSPSLLQDARYVAGRREIFALISQELADKIRHSARKVERQHFEEWYFRPRTADNAWEGKKRVIKIRRHFTNEHVAKIYGATVFLEEQEGIQFQRTVYFDKQQEMFSGDPQVAQRFLYGMDLVAYLYVELELESYLANNVKFTFGKVNKNADWIILSVDLDSFANLKEAKEWLKQYKIPLMGKRLLDLFQKIKANGESTQLNVN